MSMKHRQLCSVHRYISITHLISGNKLFALKTTSNTLKYFYPLPILLFSGYHCIVEGGRFMTCFVATNFTKFF